MIHFRVPLAAFLLFSLTAASFSQQPSPEEARKLAEQHRELMLSQMLVQQLTQIAFNRDLQREIEADEVQIQEIRENSQAYHQKLREFHEEHREDQAEIQRLMKEGEHALARDLAVGFQTKQAELTDEMREAAEAILQPKQLERLQQIAKQQAARFRSPFRDEFGIAVGLAEELELTDAEKQELMKTIERVRKEYYDEVAQLKKDANEEILKTLPAAKRDRLKELLGETYDQAERSRLAANEARKQAEAQRKAFVERSEAERREREEAE